MSWSVYTCALPGDIDARVDAVEPPGTGTSERNDQVKAAKAAAKALIASGAIGKPEAIMVSLSGHSNPGHSATPPSSTDAVTVNVSQSTAVAVEQFDASQKQALANQQ